MSGFFRPGKVFFANDYQLRPGCAQGSPKARWGPEGGAGWGVYRRYGQPPANRPSFTVMKIKNVSGSAKTGETRGPRRAGAASGEFSDQVRAAQGADAAGSAASVAGASGVAGVDGILAAQDVGDATEDAARRQTREYGEHLLDYLETIRHGLLQGFVPMESLANLAQSMRQRRLNISDPGLLEIIQEIELRAEVELAKLSRGGSGA